MNSGNWCGRLTKNSHIPLKIFLIAVLVMFPLTILLSIAITQTVNLAEWMAGWAVAALNVALAALIYTHALRKTGQAFLIWAIGVNSVRSVCMVVVAVWICLVAIQHPVPYLAAVMSGTLCLMMAEVCYLYRRLS